MVQLKGKACFSINSTSYVKFLRINLNLKMPIRSQLLIYFN